MLYLMASIEYWVTESYNKHLVQNNKKNEKHYG